MHVYQTLALRYPNRFFQEQDRGAEHGPATLKKNDAFLEDSNTAVSEVVEYRIKECQRSE